MSSRVASPETLRLESDGAALIAGKALPLLPSLVEAFADLVMDRPGRRVFNYQPLTRLTAGSSALNRLVSDRLGNGYRAVRALFLDKTLATNWSLDWHQDRTICVRRRVDVDGFGPWTVKSGKVHVAPPFELLSRMITIRVHLDAVGARNAPLRIAPGSHLFGRIDEGDIPAVIAQCGTFDCLAQAGDIWFYSTPILHSSKAAEQPTGRRVLQLDFSADNLPAGLEWEGV